MDIEYEIKVLEIEGAQLVTQLLEIGLIQREPQAFRRYVYPLAEQGAWMRLRTDGQATKLTYKRFESDAIDGTKELEVDVSDFAKTHELLQTLGYSQFVYQENRRTVFSNDDVEISIDEWPLIPAYAEIEAKDKATVERYLEKLGLQTSQLTSEPTSKVYERYGHDINSFQHLAFEDATAN